MSNLTHMYDLSVVTVCKNAMQFLPRCIASIQPLYSTSLSVEHLIIDGASSDGTAEYLQEQLIQGKITNFVSEPDKGLYDAMNKGIHLAKGKIIVFINADDEIVAKGAEACCEPILAGRAEYTAGCALCVSETNESHLLKPNIKKVLWRQPYCHQSMYCSTELLRKVGGFEAEKFRIGADTELMRRLYIMNVPFEAVSETAAHFHAGGVSYSPEVRSEVFELILHFSQSYEDIVQKKPFTSFFILKHLRRYAVRKCLQTESKHLSENDINRIRDLIYNIGKNTSPLVKLLLKATHTCSGVWYKALQIITSKHKNRLNAELCKLINKSL